MKKRKRLENKGPNVAPIRYVEIKDIDIKDKNDMNILTRCTAVAMSFDLTP